MSELTPLTEYEKQKFWDYADSARCEPNGDECQWASYTLRALKQIQALEQQVEAATLIAWALSHGFEYCWSLDGDGAIRWSWFDESGNHHLARLVDWDGKGLPPLPEEVKAAIKSQMEGSA